ncbi:MAG TPA: hypothetical protein VE821_15700 [Pyrinomonadaceae bacterium]|nr:hypothetical protein [Pyrinomonadaceae bacterium]
MFPITSRYYGIKTAQHEPPDGKQIAYLRRRFIPPPERFDLLFAHVVTEGERLDNITFKYMGDPEQFWRICDANAVLRPNELTDTIGRSIRITMPAGIPATPNA